MSFLKEFLRWKSPKPTVTRESRDRSSTNAVWQSRKEEVLAFEECEDFLPTNKTAVTPPKIMGNTKLVRQPDGRVYIVTEEGV